MIDVIRPLLTLLLALSLTSSVASAAPGGVLVRSVGRYLAKETGQEASTQTVAQMTKQVGEELIERTAQKIVREGGEQSLAEVGELVAKHGPDVIRALDNAPDALPVLKLLDELPADEIGNAASRLAAGSSGRELATLSTKLGTTVLRAEAMHPGVGLKYARTLGSEGTELCMKLTTDQAIEIGRHVDDIARLPASQQSQLIDLISSKTEACCEFVGRFVEENPGKVLFTAASTTVLLANADAIFGEGEVLIDADGNIICDANGKPLFRQPGLVPEIASGVGNVIKAPVQTTLYLAGGALVLLITLFGTATIWMHFRKYRREVAAASNATNHAATHGGQASRTADPLPQRK